MNNDREATLRAKDTPMFVIDDYSNCPSDKIKGQIVKTKVYRTPKSYSYEIKSDPKLPTEVVKIKGYKIPESYSYELKNPTVSTENGLKSLKYDISYTYGEGKVYHNAKELKSPLKKEASLEEIVDSFNRKESFGISYIASKGEYAFLEILTKYDLVENNNQRKYSLKDMSNVTKDGLLLVFNYPDNNSKMRITEDLLLFKLVPKTRKKITLRELLGEDN